jgi:hypothetical protein
MIPLTTTLSVPDDIVVGLTTGVLERVGGVVRDAETKQIVLWLREGAASAVTPTPSPQLLSLLGASSVASMLTFGVTAIGLPLILQRITMIEERLHRIQQQLEIIGQKQDLSFFANFRAALDLAANALTMANSAHRYAALHQAINRFLEARHVYTGLLDTQLSVRGSAIDAHLQTVALAYLATARCYLELEEIATAQRTLAEGTVALRLRTERLVRMLLTSNPGAYLHPALRGKVSLRRLTNVYRWLDPAFDEDTVFEMHRVDLAQLVRQSDTWVKELAPIIWDHRMHYQGPRVPITNEPMPGANIEAQVFKRLPEAMQRAEVAIEDMRRFEGYQLEVETIQRLGTSFTDWRQIAQLPEPTSDGAQLICIRMPVAALASR